MTRSAAEQRYYNKLVREATKKLRELEAKRAALPPLPPRPDDAAHDKLMDDTQEARYYARRNGFYLFGD